MRKVTATLVGIVVSTAFGGAARGQESAPLAFAAAISVLPMWQVYGQDAIYGQDAVIQRAFRAVLHRDASPSELRRYRVLMQENQWREADVRRDLSQRTDYRRYSSRQRGMQPDVVVRRAYQDILGRDPDPEGLRNYGSKMINEGWTEQDVREELRRSNEYASMDRRTASADRIIRRAYQDILGRDPDPSGLESYRRNIIENGWDEHDVRQSLMRSPERRQARALGGRAVGEAEASEMVRRAYLAVLDREPDAVGMRDYTARILRDHWSEQQVANALRDSDEYRSKHP